MIKIGIQGDQGSFSEQAAYLFIEKHQIHDYEILYLINSENVLSKISNKEIDFGIFAMQNAQGGLVIESVNALATHLCNIVDMFEVMINQNLLAMPGVTAKEIKSIHSHRQAIRQCKRFLADHFWGIHLIEENDTAESAKKLSQAHLPKTAAVIANERCAEIYGLEILQKNIHDLKNNYTLFLAVKSFE